MADEVIDTVKPVVRPAPAKAVAKPSSAKTSGFEVPKELLDDIDGRFLCPASLGPSRQNSRRKPK